MNGIALYWNGSGFGNALIVAHVTQIINDNGLSAVYVPHRTTNNVEVDYTLVDVPLYNEEEHGEFYYYRKKFPSYFYFKDCDETIIQRYLSHIGNELNRRFYIDIVKHNHVPVTYDESEEEGVECVDVAMCTSTSSWAPYRDWPYFEQLKQLFDKNRITYVDMNQQNIKSHKCLAYVKNCKLYLGLETGMSHYVSKFANGKTLIIQSGFAPFYYWASLYNYDFIRAENLKCKYKPCFIDRKFIEQGKECYQDVACMTLITPEQVFNEVLRRI